ncbi:MAG: hypothetical protein J7L15_03050 [Clostridiales bacterium]|nr:hypothetical protein [Clostridiales bacterium]
MKVYVISDNEFNPVAVVSSRLAAHIYNFKGYFSEEFEVEDIKETLSRFECSLDEYKESLKQEISESLKKIKELEEEIENLKQDLESKEQIFQKIKNMETKTDIEKSLKEYSISALNTQIKTTKQWIFLINEEIKDITKRISANKERLRTLKNIEKSKTGE